MNDVLTKWEKFQGKEEKAEAAPWQLDRLR